MNDEFGLDDLPVARKSVLPGRGFFDRSADRPAPPTEDPSDADVIAVADPDADGLAATAIVRAHHGRVTLVATEPRELDDTLEHLSEDLASATAVYVLDLCPDDLTVVPSVERLVSVSERVVWFDHHRWDPEVRAAVEGAGVDLTVGESDEVATTNLAHATLGDDLDDRWSDLAEVVRDHDLWLREDPRSDDVADFAHWADNERFIEVVTEHGADLPSDVRAFLEERRAEKADLVEAATARAEYRVIHGVTLAITYGRCSQNEVAERLRQAGADAAVVIKPSGGVSLRGGDGFRRCHEVAQRLGGGGHPEAAGCKPPVYDDLLDYAHHWTTHGASARHAVLEAFRDVVDADD